MAGLVLDFCLRTGMPAYPILFVTIAVLLAAVWLTYAIFGQRGESNGRDNENRPMSAVVASGRCPHAKKRSDRHTVESIKEQLSR